MPVRFCEECENLLYPRTHPPAPTRPTAENPNPPPPKNKLYYGCRNCDYEIEAGGDERMVYANELLSVVTEKPGVTEDVEMDPTLPRSNMECPTCHAKECVFFQDQSKRKITNMRLFYKCVSCKSVFTDVRANEGPEKDRERLERERRINDEKTKKSKKDDEPASAPAPVPTAGTQPAQVRRVVPEDNESDGEY